MAYYKATNTQTGEVVEYDEPAPRAEHLVAPWRCERVEAAPPPASPPPPGPVYRGRRLLSRLEFLRLFTPQERIAIRSASTQNSVLADFVQLLELADEVNLDSADSAAGVNLLERSGLIGAGRAAEVLYG